MVLGKGKGFDSDKSNKRSSIVEKIVVIEKAIAHVVGESLPSI